MGDGGQTLSINNFDSITSASEELNAAASSYKQALETIKSKIEETKNYWIGKDADDYRNTVLKAIGQTESSGGESGDGTLAKVGESIASHAETLESIATVLRENSNKISNSVKGQ